MKTLLILLALLPQTAFAASSEIFGETTLLLMIVLVFAKVVGILFSKFGVPELVGELLAGVVLGNLALVGINFDLATQIHNNFFMQYAAELGVVILLFLVGLESTVHDLLKVGWNSFNVATVGVVLPVLLGVGTAISLGTADGIGAWFIGATLAATSVGITAKILGDAHLIKAPSSQVILGAAVIDDVLGILLLAVLAGVVTSGVVEFGSILKISISALLFFAGCFVFRATVMPVAMKISTLNTSAGFWTAASIATTLAFAQIASFVGLAPIIGAFMAGLILEEVHFANAKGKMSVHNLIELLRPIMDFLLPIFFVSIGAQVKLDVLANPTNLLAILLLSFVAVAGKILAGLVVKGKGFDRLGIGIGMIPRGEVGLIFAAYALSHNVLSSGAYSVLVFVVLFSTILGPVLLKPRLKQF